MARAVVIIADEPLRRQVSDILKSVGFEIEAYAFPREWPFLGEIRGGRCFRTNQCGAEALIVDDSLDSFWTGVQVLLHQATQGCMCMKGIHRDTRAAIIRGDPRPILDVGVAVFSPDKAGWVVGFTRWAQEAIKTPSWLKEPVESSPGVDVKSHLFMRCPYTEKVISADSLKAVQEHLHGLGHLLAPKQVYRVREENWCTEDGTPCDPPQGDLDALRLTT